MCDCADLVGLQYRLGATGQDGEIDCIHLVYTVQKRLGIPVPALNPAWYSASRMTVARALLEWGDRVEKPCYDGDVLLFPQDSWAFGVIWQQGALYINRHLERVNWCSLGQLSDCHCFRMKNT